MIRYQLDFGTTCVHHFGEPVHWFVNKYTLGETRLLADCLPRFPRSYPRAIHSHQQQTRVVTKATTKKIKIVHMLSFPAKLKLLNRFIQYFILGLKQIHCGKSKIQRPCRSWWSAILDSLNREMSYHGTLLLFNGLYKQCHWFMIVSWTRATDVSSPITRRGPRTGTSCVSATDDDACFVDGAWS